MGRSRTKTFKVITEYLVDDKKLNASDAAAKRVMEGFESTGKAASRARTQANQYLVEIVEIARREDELARAHLKRQAFLKRLTEEYKDAGRAVESYGDKAKRARDEVEHFGDVATNVSQVSGALRGFGAGGIADAGMIAADIADAVEGARRLGPAMQQVGQSVANVVPGISSAAAGLTTLGIAGLAVAAAAVAATIAFEALKKANEAAVETVQSWIDATNEYNASGPGSIDEARQSVEDWNAEIAENAKRIELLQQSYNTATEGMGVVTRVAEAIDWNGVKTLREELERLTERNAELNILIGETRTEFGAVVDVTKALVTVEGELETKRLEQVAAAERLATAQAEYQGRLEQQAQRTRDAALDALDAQREQAKFLDELRGIADTSAQEAQFTTASEKRIESLNAAFAKFTTDAEKRIENINSKLQADLSKAQRDFMAEGVSATSKYLDQERKLQEDYNRDRIRLIQDMNDDLLSAEEDNDVIRFIRAQRAGEKRLSRFDEDASVESRRRSQEFVAEQKERRKEYNQRIADLKAAAQQRINAEREKMAERRALLQQQIADERAALTQQIQDARSAAVAMVQARRQQYAQELADAQRTAQHRAAIDAMYAKSMAAAAKQAAAYTPAYKPIVKTGSTGSSYTTSFSKPASYAPTINIGSIGSGVSYSTMTNVVKNAFSDYFSAVQKAYAR